MLNPVKDDFLDYLYNGLSDSDDSYGEALNERLNSRVKF